MDLEERIRTRAYFRWLDRENKDSPAALDDWLAAEREELAQKRLHKNAVCDLLMREGIDGRQDADAVDRTVLLTDLAVELGRKDSLACALLWYEKEVFVTNRQSSLITAGRTPSRERDMVRSGAGNSPP